MTLRAFVVDDTVLFRKVVGEALASLPGVEVVGSAGTGRQAVSRIAELRPDVVTLDIEMPDMDGLAVLDALRAARSEATVIVVSALTRQGGDLTLRALEKGAFDFVTKPAGGGLEANRASIREALAPRLAAVGRRRELRTLLTAPSPAPPTARVPLAPLAPLAPGATAMPLAPRPPASVESRMARVQGTRPRPEVLLVGVSTGGPNALAKLLPALPGDLGVPILVVQHMPPLFTQSLAASLDARTRVRVREATDGAPLEPNVALIAPGGRHMQVSVDGGGARIVRITDDPPENNCRPAVDYLFRSVALRLPGKAAAVILTGMGSDGALGVRLLKRAGCFTIAQDEATCVVYGMPRALVDAGLADAVLPLDAIAPRLVGLVRGTA